MIPLIILYVCSVAQTSDAHAQQPGLAAKPTTTVEAETSFTPPEQMPGWPKYMGVHPNYKPSGVSLVDINNDGYLEIIAGSTNSMVYIWDYQGNNMPGWPVTLPAAVQSKTAVGDIDNNGDAEIIIAARNGYVYIYNHDGTPFPNWPQNANGVLPLISPTLFDLNGDGDLEIIMVQMQSGQPGHVYVWHPDGQVFAGWPQNTDYLGVATASVADVDNDSLYEIAALSYYSVYVWDQNGNLKPGWPKLNVAGGMSYAQPVIADLDDDDDLEILHAYYLGSQDYIGIYHHDGTTFSGWPQTYPGPQTYTTPVTADIDMDNDLEIFGGGHVFGGNDFSVRHHTGVEVAGWPVQVGMLECSPIIFDVDDDGQREILIANNSTPGTFYAFENNGTYVADWPTSTTAAALVNSAAVADVDRDGDSEIALVVMDGTVNLWTLPGVVYRGYLVDWKTFFHDDWNTGWFHPAPPQNLTGVGYSDHVQLIWSVNAEPDLDGYHAYRSDVSGGPYTKLNTTLIADTTYDDYPGIPGTYYYCVTAEIKAAAESRLSNEVSGYVGISEESPYSPSSIVLHPNPFTKSVTFATDSPTYQSIKIYNASGALIHAVGGHGRIDWHPEQSLATGIYFARIETDQTVAYRKIIKLE